MAGEPDLDEDLEAWRRSRGTVTLQFDAQAFAPQGIRELPVLVTVPAVWTKNVRFPLVVFTGGFATFAGEYSQLAADVAAGGCAFMRYDLPDADRATDNRLVAVLSSLLDYAAGSPVLQKFVNSESVFLAGHSRGAKISCLLAVSDERVAGLCLLDPVDNTRWAPKAPEYPSACDALKSEVLRVLPVAIVGAEEPSECAPLESNYIQFYEAASSPTWLLVLPGASHAQFLDPEGLGKGQRLMCGGGAIDDATVLAVATAACLAWVELTCGPLVIDGVASSGGGDVRFAAERTISLTEIRRKRQIATASGMNLRMRNAIAAAGIAANVTAGRLRQYGVILESLVKM